VLVAVFYYPVATVFVEAAVVDDRLTLAPVVAVLADPFFTGWVAGLITDPVGFLAALADPGALWDLLAATATGRVGIIGFTAYQAALSTVLSVAIGLPAAWILARFEFRGRRTLRSLTVLPFVLPSIMVAIGFVAMFGANGPLNRALVALGLGRVDLLFTLEAILLAHAFYNAPLVARITAAAWEGVDASMVETARSLGASPTWAFLHVVAPQLLPAIAAGATLTFLFTFASFPIVLALGGFELATVEVFVFSQVQNLEYTGAAALAAVETLLSLGITFAYIRYERRERGSRGARPQPRRPLLPAEWTPGAVLTRLAVAGYAAVAVVLFVGPLASMVLASVTGPDGFTLANYAFLVERQATGAAFRVKPLTAIRNSLVFAAGALALAVPMGVTVAVLTGKRARGGSLVGALAMAPFAVSGIVVGLGLLRGLVFGVEVAGWRITATGALAVVVAHAVGAYPFVTRTVGPALSGIDRRLVESARSLGASRARALVDVELPIAWPGVVAGAAFVVAISVGEFDATVILASGTDSYTMPVAVQRYIGRRLGPATAMGVVLLVVTSLSFLVIERFGGFVREI